MNECCLLLASLGAGIVCRDVFVACMDLMMRMQLICMVNKMRSFCAGSCSG